MQVILNKDNSYLAPSLAYKATLADILGVSAIFDKSVWGPLSGEMLLWHRRKSLSDP